MALTAHPLRKAKIIVGRAVSVDIKLDLLACKKLFHGVDSQHGGGSHGTVKLWSYHYILLIYSDILAACVYRLLIIIVFQNNIFTIGLHTLQHVKSVSQCRLATFRKQPRLS